VAEKKGVTATAGNGSGGETICMVQAVETGLVRGLAVGSDATGEQSPKTGVEGLPLKRKKDRWGQEGRQ